MTILYILYITMSLSGVSGFNVLPVSQTGLPGAFLRVFLDGALGRH